MHATICEVAVPRSDEFPPSWVMDQADAVDRECAAEVLGEPDFSMPLVRQVRSLRDQADQQRLLLVAVAGSADQLPPGPHGLPALSLEAELAPAEGTVLGTADVSGSTRENLSVANVHVDVAGRARRQGLGRALLAAAEEVAAGWGRTTLQAWSEHHMPQPGAPQLVPATGVGAIARDRTAEFCLAAGYQLEQCEVHSVCPLPTDEDLLDRLWQQALPHAEDYRLLTAVDRLPEAHLESYAALVRHFSVEVPNGDLENEMADFDGERLRRGEERRAAMGRHSVTTMALHRGTGEVAAATRIDTDADHDQVCFQEITVVDREHRGHRLGMLVKVANHRAMTEHHTERRRIHTWNAGENQWMLAINQQLGFQSRTVEGAWQKRR